MKKKRNIVAVIQQQPNFVLDSGIWISYIENENFNLTSILKKHLFHETSDKKIYGNSYILSEIGYILCRLHGTQVSKESISYIESAMINESPDKIFIIAT